MQFIVLNLTANLLGLGNASTPFGIAAMKALEEEEFTETADDPAVGGYATAGSAASNNMVLFVVMNTARPPPLIGQQT